MSSRPAFARFRIPVGFYLHGREQDCLDLTAAFSHGRMACQLALSGEAPLVAPSLPEESRQFRTVKFLKVVLERDLTGQVEAAFTARDLSACAKLVRSLGNRCIRAIRNFGFIPELHELEGEDDPDMTLRRWNVQVREQDGTWVAVAPPVSGFIDLPTPLGWGRSGGQLRVADWAAVQTAVVDDRPPPPEAEFTVNAVEHLRNRSFRLAIVETVIGVEIVLTRYLKAYLSLARNAPAQRIERFLSAELPLSTRLAGCLDLSLPGDVIASVDLAAVERCIRWRNAIIHKTGNIPQGVAPIQIREAITAALKLVDILAYQTMRVVADAEFQPIRDEVMREHSGGPLHLQSVDVHEQGGGRVLVVCSIADDLETMDTDAADAILATIKRGFAERRPDFNPENLNVGVKHTETGMRVLWEGGAFRAFKELPLK